MLQEAVTELRKPNAALLFAALTEAVTKPLAAELRELRAEVAALEVERALPQPATPERIDRAIAVEMQAAPDDGPMVKAARWLERRLRRK